MVALVPFKKLEIDTKLNSQELVSVLSNSITSLKWSQRNSKPFMGDVSKTEFFVMRATYMSYGALPVAFGQILEVNGQTRLRVMIRYPVLGIISAPVILVAPIIPLYVLGQFFHLGVPLALLGVILSYTLVLAQFNAESSTLSKFLVNVSSG